MYVTHDKTRSHLERGFGKAHLPLDVLSRPLAGDDPVFGLDIQPPRAVAPQIFRMFPGDEQVNVAIQGIDRKREQLVLYVREERRSFNLQLPSFRVMRARRDFGDQWLAAILADGGLSRRDVVHADAQRNRLVVRQYTDARARHMLMGRDERQLFVAQLHRPAVTVEQAHRLLRAEEVGRDFKRQGEWFFRAPTDVERGQMDRLAGTWITGTRCSLGDAWGGRIVTPKRRSTRANFHLADEVRLVQGGTDRLVFARGKIRHPEHRTLRLHTWMRALMNREAVNPAARLGISWID